MHSAWISPVDGLTLWIRGPSVVVHSCQAKIAFVASGLFENDVSDSFPVCLCLQVDRSTSGIRRVGFSVDILMVLFPPHCFPQFTPGLSSLVCVVAAIVMLVIVREPMVLRQYSLFVSTRHLLIFVIYFYSTYSFQVCQAIWQRQRWVAPYDYQRFVYSDRASFTATSILQLDHAKK